MKYETGDLIKMAKEGQFDAIIHGCNIHNTFGSGIAAQIREQLPNAARVDSMTKAGDRNKLGLFTLACEVVDDGHAVRIFNAYTQGSYGRRGVHVDYDGLNRAFMGIKLLYDLDPNLTPIRFGIPKIGALRGGGDWDVISAIIEDIGFRDITCVVWDQEDER